MLKAVGLGAGGHAKVVIELLRQSGGVELVGLTDPRKELWGTSVLGVPVLGDDSSLSMVYRDGVRHAFIGVGSVGTPLVRKCLYELAHMNGFMLIHAVHPQAVISPSAVIGEGATIMAGALINTDARLGENVIINTGAIVEHDCSIGNHVHIATGARLASTVCVGDETHVGVGATVKQSINIGRNVIVGAGAAVVHDVADNTVVAGVPARVLRSGVR